MATGAAIGLTALGLFQNQQASKKAAGIARRNSEAAAAAIPKNINVGFPTGSFSFENLGNGNFNSSLNAGLSAAVAPIIHAMTINPSLIGKQDFSVLDSINETFGDISNRFNQLDNNVEQLGGLFDETNQLKTVVKPGFSKVRSARLGQINNAESNRTSNLRDSLARRRISGSSFAEDTLSRTSAEFAQQRADTEAKTILEEIDATSKLLTFQNEIVTRAASIINAKLSGQLQAASEQAGNERFKITKNQETDMFNATQEQNANLFNANAQNVASIENARNELTAQSINIQSEVAAMNAAFGFTQAAMNAVTGLSGALTTANESLLGVLGDHNQNTLEIIGAGAGIAAAERGGDKPKTTPAPGAIEDRAG